MRTFVIVTIAAFIVLNGCKSNKSQSDSADIIWTHGKIYTLDVDQPWAEAVAVKENNIVYVGSNEGVAKFKSDSTIVNNLNGKMMLPGLISTHEHPLVFSALSSGLVLDYTGDSRLMLKILEEYIDQSPEGPFISFGGAYESPGFITRYDIDKIVADQPFIMISQSGHGGWCNTKALEVAGITKDTPDPIDYFERDKDGNPTGYLGSSASTFWMVAKLELITKEAILKNANDIFTYISSQGITTVQDAGNPGRIDKPVFDAVAEIEKEGMLPIRINAAVMAQRPVHMEDVIKTLKNYHGKGSELFQINTLKIHGDGDFGGFTAGLLEPYANNPESKGIVSFPDQEQLNKFMIEAASMDKNIIAHACGDRTIRSILDGFEAVRDAGYNVRLTTHHTMLVHEEDLHRYKELDVHVNTFATNIAVPNEAIELYLGKKRSINNFMPMNSFVKQGLTVSLSADWPTEELNPFLQIYTAVTRSRIGEEEFLPPGEEKLTLADAIKAYTIWSAYQLGMEDIIGSIEVGKRADLIITNQDILNVELDKIPETKVLLSMMNGKVVFELGDEVDEELIEDFDDLDLCEDVNSEHSHE